MAPRCLGDQVAAEGRAVIILQRLGVALHQRPIGDIDNCFLVGIEAEETGNLGQGTRHGGPVEPGRGFVLHSTDWGGQDTLHVAGPNGKIFAMTGTIDVLKAIAEGRGPSQWIAALGYAGWGEGQLDEEMTRHGWFAAQGTPAILFDTPTDERWAAAFKAEGIDPRLLASETGAA